MTPAEDKPDFEWRRITAEGVEVLGIEGPPFDHDEHRDKFFVFVSASQAQEGKGLSAYMSLVKKSGGRVGAKEIFLKMSQNVFHKIQNFHTQFKIFSKNTKKNSIFF